MAPSLLAVLAGVLVMPLGLLSTFEILGSPAAALALGALEVRLTRLGTTSRPPSLREALS